MEPKKVSLGKFYSIVYGDYMTGIKLEKFTPKQQSILQQIGGYPYRIKIMRTILFK